MFSGEPVPSLSVHGKLRYDIEFSAEGGQIVTVNMTEIEAEIVGRILEEANGKITDQYCGKCRLLGTHASVFGGLFCLSCGHSFSLPAGEPFDKDGSIAEHDRLVCVHNGVVVQEDSCCYDHTQYDTIKD